MRIFNKQFTTIQTIIMGICLGIVLVFLFLLVPNIVKLTSITYWEFLLTLCAIIYPMLNIYILVDYASDGTYDASTGQVIMNLLLFLLDFIIVALTLGENITMFAQGWTLVCSCAMIFMRIVGIFIEFDAIKYWFTNLKN